MDATTKLVNGFIVQSYILVCTYETKLIYVRTYVRMYLSWNCITTIIVYVLQCYDIEIKEYKSLDNAIFRIYVHSFANRKVFRDKVQPSDLMFKHFTL